jgi:hypothetical protein
MEFFNDKFIYWATERDKIRERREAGLPREEWTEDHILKNYRFCNVSREDDRTTIWIKEHIRDPFDAHGDEQALFQSVALSRFLNLPESLGVLIQAGILEPGTPLDLHAAHDELDRHQKSHKDSRVFAPAYMVGAPDNPRTWKFGYDKFAYVCGVLNECKIPEHRETREGFVTELCKQFGFAEFMAGQIAADLAYTSVLRNASDHMTWSPRGPGAMRGMNGALGKPVDRKIPRQEYLEVGRAQFAALPKDLVEDRRLTLHDVASNVNCEVFKYLKGGGRRRLKDLKS